jgi:hypothetical protein
MSCRSANSSRIQAAGSLTGKWVSESVEASEGFSNWTSVLSGIRSIASVHRPLIKLSSCGKRACVHEPEQHRVALVVERQFVSVARPSLLPLVPFGLRDERSDGCQ